MTYEVRITQRYKRVWKKSEVSGHEWPEDTLLNKWDIHTICGIAATVNSFEKAEKVAKEWVDFYKLVAATDPKA